MTEDDAKTKYCPIAKLGAVFDGNWNKGHCMGSACMAWRWIVKLNGPDHGYCGLAGAATSYSVGKP